MNTIIDTLIKNAEKLGTLSATAIWAFFTLILLGYIAWNLKNQRDGEKRNFEMRIKDAETDGAVAAAVDKIANEFRDLRRCIKCTGGKND